MKKLIVSAIAFSTIIAQVAMAADVEFNGSVRLRYEQAASGALGTGEDEGRSWTTQQTRFSVKAQVKPEAQVFIQLQDARTWGGEDQSFPPPSATNTGTDASANAFDMHQGYFLLTGFGVEGLSLKAGRQEIIFDDSRLIGNIGWIQNAQAFDGMRFSHKGESISWDLISSQVLANDTHPVMNPYLASYDEDAYFYAAHASFKVGNGVVNPFVYQVDKPTRLKPGVDENGDPNTVRFTSLQTSGLFIKQKIGPVGLMIHAANQTGDVTETKKHAASMVTVKLSSKLGPIGVALGNDQYSGDKEEGGDESNTFNALYATNHKFFGFMDKFLFTPTTGLVDTYLQVGGAAGEKGKWAIHYHKFATGPSSYLPSEDAGAETDITYKRPFAGANWQLGYSSYTASDVNYGTTGNTALASTWAYMQATVAF